MVEPDCGVSQLVKKQALKIVAVVERIDGRHVFITCGDVKRSDLGGAIEVEDDIAGVRITLVAAEARRPDADRAGPAPPKVHVERVRSDANLGIRRAFRAERIAV